MLLIYPNVSVAFPSQWFEVVVLIVMILIVLMAMVGGKR